MPKRVRKPYDPEEYQRNKERIKANHKRWREKNKEKTKAANAEWYQATKETRRERRKELRDDHYDKNRVKIIEKRKVYFQTSTGKYAQARSGAKKRGYAFDITADFYCMLIEDKCYYCGDAPAKGVDRFDNTVGYTPENCVPCCYWCNRAKMDGTWEMMLEKVKKIHSRHC